MSGRLVVLEGLDGVGKTTVARRLAAALGAVFLTTPDEGLRGAREEMDRWYAASPDAAHLFYASSVAYASAVAERETARGRDVVIDRYWLSTWTYAVRRGTRLSLEEVERSLLAAHCTLLVTLDEGVRIGRLRARGCTAEDRATFDPRVAAALDARYREGLRRAIAGRGTVLDVTGRSEDECLAAAVAVVR